MTVYVDELFTLKGKGGAFLVGRRNGHQWCHMMADDELELHAFAARLGLRRKWFQGDHYDLTPGRRELAVKFGAREVTSRDLVALRRAHRKAGAA